ncbi:DsrE family protein [Oricola cellulosilytica]|uniref:Multidrug transporter n=1 Tax=Oricola cellulosilytica TaxID=1429082 RepID=A0A4R0PFK3_9HYPH|nr:DsrE family protein [Oricola cellulosilytica]TCD16616.1 multidrug transporter [Oricola cellulosilytica]
MTKMLVHVHTGPQDPTKATLAFLVAATAAEEEDVSVFLAGDAVHLFAPETIASLEGQGTGRLRDHLQRIEKAGGTYYLSGKSAAARGYDDSILAERPASFAMPDVLVRLAREADCVLCY